MSVKRHPGEILLDEFLKPNGISANTLAIALGVPPTRISDIIHCRRGITADTALRLAKFFGNTAEFWLNLQNERDVSLVILEKGDELIRVQTIDDIQNKRTRCKMAKSAPPDQPMEKET